MTQFNSNTMAIRVTLQRDGSLLMQANNETRSYLAERLRENWNNAQGDFLEMVRGNYTHTFPDGKAFHYTLEELNPADIFALTDMPLLADNCRDDDDAVRVYGTVWGFPDYQVRDWLTELAYKGRTVFERVAEYGDGMTFPSRHDRRTKALAEHLAVRAFENCLDPVYVTEQVPDLHGEPGATIARLVDIAPRPPAPVMGELL